MLLVKKYQTLAPCAFVSLVTKETGESAPVMHCVSNYLEQNIKHMVSTYLPEFNGMTKSSIVSRKICGRGSQIRFL